MAPAIVLGTGKKLFRDGTDAGRLELTDSTISPNGVLLLRYTPA